MAIFLQKLTGQQVLFGCFTEANFSAWNLFELASYGKFGFSRPDLDGKKLTKGMWLARKVRDREAFI